MLTAEGRPIRGSLSRQVNGIRTIALRAMKMHQMMEWVSRCIQGRTRTAVAKMKPRDSFRAEPKGGAHRGPKGGGGRPRKARPSGPPLNVGARMRTIHRRIRRKIRTLLANSAMVLALSM